MQGREVAVLDLNACVRVRKADPDLGLPAYALELRMAETGPSPAIMHFLATDRHELLEWLAALQATLL